MKTLKIIIFLLIILTNGVNLIAQRGSASQQLLQFNATYFPNIIRNYKLVSCNPPIAQPICTYILNNVYGTNPNPSINNPFGNNDIPFWNNSHDMPRLADPFLGIVVPPGASNFALMPYSNQGGANLSSGIVQKIAPLQAGQNYLMRFFEKNASFFFLNSMAKVEIYLINCTDYQNFNVNGNTLPAVPQSSQRIFCETNYAASLQLTPWQNRVFTFQANSNYDMIWVFATPTLTGLYPQSFYCFTLAELINASTFSITDVNANNPNTCNASLYASCQVTGALFTWTGPSGQVFTGNYLLVDRGVPSNVGVWTLTLTVPTADPSNSTCGNNIEVSSQINLTLCGAAAPNCINLPLIQ